MMDENVYMNETMDMDETVVMDETTILIIKYSSSAGSIEYFSASLAA